jgi:polyhydroxybutyrate depolymerase
MRRIGQRYRRGSKVIWASVIGILLLTIVATLWLSYSRAENREEKHSAYSISVQGVERTYALFVPTTATSSSPLVVMLHGALGTADQAERSYGWNSKASEGNFIVAYPQGLHRSWAVSENCCGPSAKDGINDVEFIMQMVADIKKSHSIDANRIYAAGISNGGALAYRLACDTDSFAAIGAVATTLLGDCPSPKPVSVMHIHGLSDQTFPYQGGGGRRNNNGQGDRPADTRGPAIPDLMAMWRKTDDCGAPTTKVDGLVSTVTADCANQMAVTLITISEAGHQWPGSLDGDSKASKALNLDPPSKEITATDELWDFFSKHHRI